MELLPDDIAKRLPPLYSQEEQGENVIAVVKFFTPWTGWTWYASEYDPDKRLCFGVVVGQEREYGCCKHNQPKPKPHPKPVPPPESGGRQRGTSSSPALRLKPRATRSAKPSQAPHPATGNTFRGESPQGECFLIAREFTRRVRCRQLGRFSLRALGTFSLRALET
jgi:hypothetical protein